MLNVKWRETNDPRKPERGEVPVQEIKQRNRSGTCPFFDLICLQCSQNKGIFSLEMVPLSATLLKTPNPGRDPSAFQLFLSAEDSLGFLAPFRGFFPSLLKNYFFSRNMKRWATTLYLSGHLVPSCCSLLFTVVGCCCRLLLPASRQISHNRHLRQLLGPHR